MAHRAQDERPEPSGERSHEQAAEALRFKASHLDPIRVFPQNGQWVVDYGSYANGYHSSRRKAVETATKDARDECRELVVEASPGDPKAQRSLEPGLWPS